MLLSWRQIGTSGPAVIRVLTYHKISSAVVRNLQPAQFYNVARGINFITEIKYLQTSQIISSKYKLSNNRPFKRLDYYGTSS
jgi:hypothetical protein